jgi:O-antigen/teichoic acid export membrane protein
MRVDMESPLQEQRTNESETDRSLVHVTKQATGVMSYRLVGVVLGLGSNVIFARLLGAELLGVYVLASTMLLVASLVASFGTAQTLVRYMPVRLSRGDKEGAAGVFAFCFRLVTVVAVIGTAVLLVLRNWLANGVFHEPLLLSVLPITALGILPASLTQYLGGTLIALKQTAKEAFATEIVYKVAKLAIFLGLYFTVDMRLRALVIGFAAAYILSDLAMLRSIRREEPALLSGARRTAVPERELLAFSATMFTVAFLNYAMSITDRFMLGILSTSEDVGIYNIAFIISNILTLVYMGFNYSFAPVVSELYNNDRIPELSSLYASLTRAVSIIVVPAFIWLVGFGDDLLRIFGHEFVVGQTALVVLGLGAVVRCAVGFVANLLMMSGYQRYNVVNIVVSTLLNIVLNLYFIPKYGVLGAAIATTISVVVISVVGLVQVRAFLGLSPYRRSYLKVLAASAVALPATLYLRAHTPALAHWQIGLLLVATFAVFLGVIFLLGIERDDRILAGKLLKKLGLGRG